MQKLSKSTNTQSNSDVKNVETLLLSEKVVNVPYQKNAIDVLRDKMIDVKIEAYDELIKKHAQVALKKIKKPAKYNLDDLTQEGAIVFLYTKNEYVYRGASFKTILTKRLRGHYANLVKRTYRNKEVNNIPSWNSSQMGNFLKETILTSKNNMDTFEIVQMLFVIDNFNEDELMYINAVLSFTHKPRRSRRKAARESLGISYEREAKLRASIKDKIRK